jgi:hypothetical protein
MLWCDETQSWVLRSCRFQWPHELYESPDDATDDDSDDDDDGDDEPERVGGMYDITLEYTVTYRFRVPAWSEHEAKDRAEDLQLDARPADSYLIHSEDREVEEIMSDDPKLPDGYDTYGGTPLWDVYGENDDA